MRLLKVMLPVLIVAVLGGCAAVRVNQDYEPGADFSDLKSFTWKSETQPKTGDIRIDNPLLDSRIRHAIEMTLIDMGYRRVTRGPHDFKVGYALAVRSPLDSSSVSVGTGFGYGRRSSFGGVGIGVPLGGQPHDEVMIAIDFTDSLRGNLIWRGTGTRRINLRSTPEETSVAINTLVQKVLAQFPVSRHR